MIFESSSVGDTSCDCLALLAALDSQGFQGQLQGAVTAQQQRAHTLGLQQETHSQVLQVFAGSCRRVCRERVGAGLIFSLFTFRSCQARLLLRLQCPVTVPWDPVRAGTGRRSGAVRWPSPQVKPVVWFCANHVPFSRMEGLRRAHSAFSHRIITVSHLVQEWIELPWDLRIISVNIVFQLALGELCQVGAPTIYLRRKCL